MTEWVNGFGLKTLIQYTLCSENAEQMASGEEARFWADLYQKYTI